MGLRERKRDVVLVRERDANWVGERYELGV